VALRLGGYTSTVRERRQAEKGLWADLAARVAGPARGPGLYAGLGRRLAAAPPQERAGGLWQALAERVDPARYRPSRAAGVVEEALEEDGQAYTVLRSPSGRYVRLSAPERELWALMDGSRSVEQLATHGFLRFRQLLPVASLVASLRAAGCLSDHAAELYAGLRERSAGAVEGWGRRVARALRQREFAVGGIDGALGAIYRWGGRLLFTWPALALMALVALAGLGCFAALAGGLGAGYAVIDAGNAGWSLLALWAALLVSFVLHELAHGLAVKHFGRTVLRGGVMIYYAMPAAFVDTSDIWLAGRRARIITSLAGPASDVLVGSLAALAALLLDGGLAGGAAYKLAVAAYLAALCNLNPLLELDGYYVLSDWLGLPNLRRRGLEFISGPLWQKLRSRSALSGEERIFAIYGLCAAAYTALAVALAILFWRAQLVGVIGGLWGRGGLERLLAVALVVVVVAPLGLGLLVAAWGLVRAAAAWAHRRGLGRSPLAVAAALGALAVALAALPLRYGRTPELALLAPLLWLVALAAQVALREDYRRAAVARALDCFLAVTMIEGVALLGFALAPALGPAWSALENVGFLLLLFAGLVALLDTDLRQSSAAELAGSALLMVLAFLAAGLTIGLLQADGPGRPFVGYVLAAAPVYTSAIALALLLPQVAGLRDSRLLWSWLLLWVGIAVQTAAYVLELLAAWRGSPAALALGTLASGLWAAAWCSHYVALRQVLPRGLSWPLEPATGEAERLRRAFRHTYAGLYRSLREHHGPRRARALDDRMDVLAATANWEITLDREQARIGAELAALPLDAQGARYAEVLRYAVTVIEGLAGATFARRAVQAAYDALPWPEREAADRRCFPNAPWARDLSRAFGDARAARLRLLRQVERFAACDDGELLALAAALEPRRAPPGALLLAAGERPAGLWIVEAGEVLARTAAGVADELHRGAAFGATGAAEESPAPCAYRASVASELLYLSHAELRRLLAGAAPHAAEGAALAAVMRALERATFFHDLPRDTLRELARGAERLALPARTPVVRQGLPSGRIYVIVSGEAAVVRRSEPKAPAEPAGPPKVVARLGPDELFGELELLRRTPPQASVVALTPLELVAVSHEAVAALLRGGAARGLERLGTGRLRDLRA
jgi:putative peptide zinc metalloprotease protein